MVTGAGENSPIDLIERTLAHEICTFEEAKDKMSNHGRSFMAGHIYGLAEALRLTERYPEEQPFDREWAQRVNAAAAEKRFE